MTSREFHNGWMKLIESNPIDKTKHQKEEQLYIIYFLIR